MTKIVSYLRRARLRLLAPLPVLGLVAPLPVLGLGRW